MERREPIGKQCVVRSVSRAIWVAARKAEIDAHEALSRPAHDLLGFRHRETGLDDQPNEFVFEPTVRPEGEFGAPDHGEQLRDPAPTAPAQHHDPAHVATSEQRDVEGRRELESVETMKGGSVWTARERSAAEYRAKSPDRSHRVAEQAKGVGTGLDQGAAPDSAPKLAIGDACRVCSLTTDDAEMTSRDAHQSAVGGGRGTSLTAGDLRVPRAASSPATGSRRIGRSV